MIIHSFLLYRRCKTENRSKWIVNVSRTLTRTYIIYSSLWQLGQEINKKISHRLAFSNGGCPSSYNTLQLKPRGSPLIMQTLKSLLWNTHYHDWHYLRKYSNYIWSIRTLDLSLTTWESISKFNQVVFLFSLWIPDRKFGR